MPPDYVYPPTGKPPTREELDEAKERVAIIMEAEQCSQHKAERITAECRGYPTWTHFLNGWTQ